MPETTMAYPSVPRARNINDPIEPTGNKLLSGVGPAAWAERADRPDLTIHGDPKIVPMRTAPEFFVEPRDPDPRGYAVVGCDGAVGGTVAELWVDKSEPQVRYLEVLVASTGKLVLVPVTCARVDVTGRRVQVKSITAAQFADVPATKAFHEVTLLEEDKIQAYFAGGYLYATPARVESAWI
jgi:photosynthetic reaction center H subunit